MLTRLLSSGLLASVFSLNLLPLTAGAMPLQINGGRNMTVAQNINVDPINTPRPVRPQVRRPGVQRVTPAQFRGNQPNERQRTDYTGTYRARVRDGNFSMDVVMKLNANGSAEMQTDYPGYEPIQERGNWRVLNDSSVLVIFSEIDGQTAEAFNVLGFRATGNQLMATVYDPDIYGMDRLTLRKESSAQNPPSNNTDFSGTYTAFLPAEDTPGIDLSLNLKRDGTAQMTTDYLDNEDPLVETGIWRTNRDGSVSVVLDKLDGYPADPANVLRFRVNNNNTLVATNFDPDIYGSDGLTLRKRR